MVNQTSEELLLTRLENNDPETLIARFQTHTMTSQDIKRLANAISKNTHVKELHLLDCHITENDIPVLHDAMRKNHSIIIIEIEDFKNDTQAIKELIEKIREFANRNAEQHNHNFRGLTR